MKLVNKVREILKFFGYIPNLEVGKNYVIWFDINGFESFGNFKKTIIRMILGDKLLEFYYAGGKQYIYIKR
jgi:hypothetical protein